MLSLSSRLRHFLLFVIVLTFGLLISPFAYAQISSDVSDDPFANVDGIITIGGALTVIVCGLLARAYRQRREAKEAADILGTDVESMSDEIWELQETVERTKELLNLQGDLVLGRDYQNRITFVNDAFAEFIGIERKSLEGQMLDIKIIEQKDEFISKNGVKTVNQLVQTPSGQRWVAWRETSLSAGLNDTKLLVIGRDVTEHIEGVKALANARETAETSNLAKSKFLARVSHEVRTPLAGISGMVNLLNETQLNAEQRSYLNAIKTSTSGLSGLIDDILDYSKIEAGHMRFEKTSFNLVDLVEGVAELQAPQAKAKQLDISSDFDEKLPRKVIGDPARLRQVLLNLVSNAVKFTEKGGVIITVTKKGKDRIAFSVQDTGIGIAPKLQGKIFQEFEQGEANSNIAHDTGNGAGLGLSISKRIIEGMGGQISLVSRLGVGSTFAFDIHLSCEEQEAPFEAPDLSGKQILILSNSITVGPILSQKLSRWGANTVLAHDVANAEDLLVKQRFNIIITDRAIGYDALKKAAPLLIHKCERALILLDPTERDRLDEFMALGFDAYLIKPIRGLSLAQRIIDEAPLVPEKTPQIAIEKTSQETRAPIALPASVPNVEENMPATKKIDPEDSLSILVAEDDPVNALLTEKLLRNMGHHPRIVQTGREALHAVEHAFGVGVLFDLILMDCQMPEMDGISASSEIRKREARYGKYTPIIALTANNPDETLEKAKQAGIDDFLEKPLTEEKLQTVLRTVRLNIYSS